MRTTLSLDDDVAAQIDQLRRRRGGTFKEIVNEALRQGLAQLDRPVQTSRRSRTRAVSLGRPRVGDADNVAELLAVAEGDSFR
ncbi:MAG TPA: CopG family transcriptional regulator [Mycobacteriales bacterium]|jgi:hypothetical protein|nr:CopG family transcriptional regulator [Mycobacteriales bacterium]